MSTLCCDRPGASKTGTCASRALLQAKLKLPAGSEYGACDPDTAGAPTKPATKPTDASDYEAELSYLMEQLRQEPPAGYIISENCAKYAIILHCRTMKDTSTLMAVKTDEEKGHRWRTPEPERLGPIEAADVGISALIHEPGRVAVNACRATKALASVISGSRFN